MTAPGIPIDDGSPVNLNLTSYRKIFDRPSWHGMGACRDKPTKWWFSNKPHELMAAMIVCRELCPVRFKCLADNLDVPQGIFGGFSADERKTIRDHYSVIVSPELMQLLVEEDGGIEKWKSTG